VKAKQILDQEYQKTQQFIHNKDFLSAENNTEFLLKHGKQDPKIYELVGDVYFGKKDYKKSVWYFFKAAEQKENDHQLLCKISENLYYLKKYENASSIIAKAIEINPAHAYSYIILGMCKKEMGIDEEAVMAFEDAININPQEILAYLNLGLFYKQKKDYENATKVYQQGIVNNPGNHFILSNLGNLFYLEQKYDDAILSHQRAVKAKPDSPIVYYNYANTLLHAGKIEDSNKVYKKAIEIDSNFARAHVNLGTNLLTYQNFEDGFKEYSWRMYLDEKININNKQGKKIWKGEEISGKNLLVCSESGFGNVIQFSRYLPILKEQFNCNIIFSCPDEIGHLFSHLDFIDQIIDPSLEFDDYEYWIPLHSLIPIITPNPAESCPEPMSLHVNENKMIEWETLMGVDNKVKIGLCWQGSIKNPRDHLNSIELSNFKNLFNIENTSFISLQKGHGHHQIAKNNFSENMIDYDMLVDTGSQKFLDTTAIIKYLDLVITTDTSIAHLAGSLGTQTWLLLPKLSDWRWFQNNEETIWYENMRLFRQTNNGDWSDVIKKVNDEAIILCKNLYDIRKDMKPDEVQEAENSVTEDIQLNEETQSDTVVSAEDMFNENVSNTHEELNEETPAAQNYSDEVNEEPVAEEAVPEETITEQTFQDETVEEPAVEESYSEETNAEEAMANEPDNVENFSTDATEEPLTEQSYSENANQEPTAEEALSPQTEENNHNDSDDGSIQPRVLRDDDGGEKIKFKR